MNIQSFTCMGVIDRFEKFLNILSDFLFTHTGWIVETIDFSALLGVDLEAVITISIGVVFRYIYSVGSRDFSNQFHISYCCLISNNYQGIGICTHT